MRYAQLFALQTYTSVPACKQATHPLVEAGCLMHKWTA